MHPCLNHDKNFPEDLIKCSPFNLRCSDCPFSKEELIRRLKNE